MLKRVLVTKEMVQALGDTSCPAPEGAIRKPFQDRVQGPQKQPSPRRQPPEATAETTEPHI